MERSMDLDEDASIETVVEATVKAIERGAHLIGKIRRDGIAADQIRQVEEAIARLQSTLDLRKRMLDA